MKSTITRQRPQGLSRWFWFSTLLTSTPGQDLSFHSAVKAEVMLLLMWSRNFLLIFPLTATSQAAPCLLIIKRDMNLLLRKEHYWLSHYHQFSTIPLFSSKTFYSRTASFIPLWSDRPLIHRRRSWDPAMTLSTHLPECWGRLRYVWAGRCRGTSRGCGPG